MIKNYQNWGDVYSITFDITVIKLSSSTWMEVFRFTATNENCCNNGDRIPALFINPAGTFHFSSSLYNGENYNYVNDIDFVLGETYHVTIKQSLIAGKYWYEIIIDGDTKVEVENKNPTKFPTVNFYTSFNGGFTYDFGHVCNFKIHQGGKLEYDKKYQSTLTSYRHTVMNFC